MAQITIQNRSVTIHDLEVEDAALVELLAATPESGWAAEVAKILTVGARGVLSMGIGVSITGVAEQVDRMLIEAAQRAEQQVAEVLGSASRALGESLDPELRSSHMARALAELGAVHQELLTRLDPGQADSHTSQLIGCLHEILGPGGLLETRIATAFESGSSGLDTLAATVREGFAELRDVVVREAGRAEADAAGTRKGNTYEDIVEERLRATARGIGGWVVERTSTTPGIAGSNALVGDFVLATEHGSRIVVEAKNVANLALHGQGGILAEVDRAMTNRSAELGICVSASNAYPGEVGSFARYGNRILVVDDGDGVLLDVAVRFADTLLAARRDDATDIDLGLVTDKLDRIQELAKRFSSSRRALTSVRSGVEAVRNDLDEMRRELVDLVGDLRSELQPGKGDARRVA